jgi:glucose-6-phosphate 1-epimerase
MVSLMQTLQSLCEQFKVHGLHFEAGLGGLARAVVATSVASGEIYLNGAHVTSWQPAGHEPVLWMSRSSLFQAGKPIRGGIPICFPWFGPHPSDTSAPAHGFARTAMWEVVEARPTTEGGISLTLQTAIDPFSVRLTVEFGSVLRMTLATELAPGVSTSHRFEDALHTYLSVSDVRNISITGLERTRYIDKVDGAQEKPATGAAIEFTAETDRVYFNTDSECQLVDPVLKRTIAVSKSGSQSTVVWNPWIAKSARMPDFGDHEWPEMVCIETANVGVNAIELAPQSIHSTTVEIKRLPVP